jgi:hypothetical protein
MRRWASEKRVTISMAVASLWLLVVAYAEIVSNPPGPKKHPHEPEVLLRLARDAIPSACVVLIAFLVVNYLLYHQQIESARQYSRELVRDFIEALGEQHTGLQKLICKRSHFDWSTLIATTDHIIIVTRYWDEEATDHRSAFIDFFMKGGRLDLLIPDPKDDEARLLAAEQRSAEFGPHEYQIAHRILRTITELRAAALNANNELHAAGKAEIVVADHLSVRYLRHAPNYEFQLFGDSDVVLAPYAHFFMPESQCPAMWFDLRYADEMREFVQCELKHFTEKRSTEVNLDDVAQLYAALRSQVPQLGSGDGDNATLID